MTVAYSPEKEPLFLALVDGFNAQRLETSTGQAMTIRPVQLSPEDMLEAALEEDPGFQALSPDSSIWLTQLDRAWSEELGNVEALAVGETVRFAVSPVVIAAWEEQARQMGWPDRDVSWLDLLARAQSDPDFRWSHPSTGSASGLLATLAEFYAGAGKSRGLTVEDVTSESTLDYVAALEKTVQFYGEGDERALIDRVLEEGSGFLDAFVVQEQMVIYHNTQRGIPERLVALYPMEGALWEDHPLALLETASPSDYQRQTFARFRDYLLSAEAQALVLRYGYRPADLSIPLDGPDSPLVAANGVDPSQPKTALQVPSPAVIDVVRDVWWYTKRHTNVYLVVDTSGSMEGQKLAGAKAALHAFLDQIQGDMERVGMVSFSTGAEIVVGVDELANNRDWLQTEIERLEADR